MADEPKRGPSSSNMETFDARGGTIDQGRDFEELMIISKCLQLTLDSNVAEFSISSDEKTFGDFGNLLIEIKYINVKAEKTAYQLRHVEDENKLLTSKILGGTGEKFAIAKYYKSCHQIPADFSLILYTNKKFEMKDKQLTMDCKIGSADVLVDIVKNFDCQYKFTVNNIAENVSNQDTAAYKKFLNRFQLMSNQENTKQLGNRIKREFLKIHGTEDTFHRFRDFIRIWKKEKNNKLNKKIVTIKIVESLLMPFMKSISHELYYTNFGALLRRAILSFNFTTFEEANKVIHKIWINSMSDGEINKCGFKYFLLTERLDEIMDKKLRANKYSLISWHLGQCPLIVEVTKDSKAAINQVVQLLRNNQIKDRKLLLLGQKEELQTSGCFRNLYSLSIDNKELHQEILEKMSLSLQGRLYKLKDIVDSEDFEKIISTDFLVKMSDPNFNIGEMPAELPEFYVPRALSRIIVDSNYLEEERTDDLILINCNGKKEAMKQHVKGVRRGDLQELLGDEGLNYSSKKIIYLHPTECSDEEYSKIIKKFPKKNCHHFSCGGDGRCLEWIKTRGSVKGLQSYVAAKEAFEKEDEFLQTNRRNLQVICADPGMGKTTMLKYFYRSISKSSWLLYISARQYASRITENMDVQNFVFSLTNDELEKQFVATFYGVRKIIFLWDGLDEVFDNEERHRIYVFIKNIQQIGFVQFMTARNNILEEIEEKLNTLATNIKELTKSEQDSFLHNRLSKKYNDVQLLNIIDKIKKNVEYLETEKILEVPLQLYLMTELFLETSNIDDLLKKPLTATTLFEYFVDNKIKTHFERFENKDSASQRIVKHAVINMYQLLGIKLCLEFIVDLNFFEKRELDALGAIQTDDDAYGFVRKSGQMSLFVHQSYAEYFAALFLSKNYGRIANFRNVYFDVRCRNLRFMLDLILAKDCPAHIAVLYRNVSTLEDHKEAILKEDEGGRNALHIALSWSQEHLLLPHIASTIKIEDYLDQFKMLASILKYILEDKGKLVPVYDEMFDMDYMSYSNKSLLKLAVVCNDIDVVRFIHSNDKSPQRKEDGNLPLFYAAFIGNLEICKFLIDNGANANCFYINNFTPLMYAAAKGYLDIIKILIDNTAKVNTTDIEGHTPLFYAARNNRLPVVQFLIENNAEVNLASVYGATPLSTAAHEGYLAIVKILIDNRAEVNTSNNFLKFTTDRSLIAGKTLEEIDFEGNYCETPLLEAAQGGYLDIVRILIDNKAEVNTTNIKGHTPLLYAARKNRLPVVQLLILNNADVNLANNDGETPLLVAADEGYLDIMQILIDHSAEVNTANSLGQTPLFSAAWKGLVPVVQLLIANNADVNLASNNVSATPLHMAAQSGHLDIAKILIQNMAKVNTVNSRGLTPLIYAAWENQFSVVQLLIENNADVNIASNNGKAPLAGAAFEGYLDIVKILIDNTVEVNLQDRHRQTALFYAASANRFSVVQLLIENKADVNLANTTSFTPLSMAARKGYLDIVKILIDNKAKVNKGDDYEQTPLLYAAWKGHFPVIKLLINNNADIDHPSVDGTTPLMIACKKGYFEVANYLLEENAKINCKDMNGNTALHLSVQENKLDIIKTLIQNGADVEAKNQSGKTPVELPGLSPDVVDYFRSINLGIEASAAIPASVNPVDQSSRKQ